MSSSLTGSVPAKNYPTVDDIPRPPGKRMTYEKALYYITHPCAYRMFPTFPSDINWERDCEFLQGVVPDIREFMEGTRNASQRIYHKEMLYRVEAGRQVLRLFSSPPLPYILHEDLCREIQEYLDALLEAMNENYHTCKKKQDVIYFMNNINEYNDGVGDSDDEDDGDDEEEDEDEDDGDDDDEDDDDAPISSLGKRRRSDSPAAGSDHDSDCVIIDMLP